jgi:hypothetical protein
LDFLGDEAMMVFLNLGLSDLDVGGKVCRFGELPCLFRQVESSKGNVVNSICLRNDDLSANLVFRASEKLSASNLGSLDVVIVPHCSEWTIVLKVGKWVHLSDFSLSSLPSLWSCAGGGGAHW